MTKTTLARQKKDGKRALAGLGYGQKFVKDKMQEKETECGPMEAKEVRSTRNLAVQRGNRGGERERRAGTGPCGTKHLRKGNIQSKQLDLTYSGNLF